MHVQVLCTDFDVAGELFADFEFLGVNLDDFSMQILVGKFQWQTEHYYLPEWFLGQVIYHFDFSDLSAVTDLSWFLVFDFKHPIPLLDWRRTTFVPNEYVFIM